MNANRFLVAVLRLSRKCAKAIESEVKLISILALFHAITFERSSFRNIAYSKQSIRNTEAVSIVRSLAAFSMGWQNSGNRQTDRHTHRPSTVTLAAHVQRGLIEILHAGTKDMGCTHSFTMQYSYLVEFVVYFVKD